MGAGDYYQRLEESGNRKSVKLQETIKMENACLWVDKFFGKLHDMNKQKSF